MLNSSIVVASGNQDKIRELKTVASEFSVTLLAPKEVELANVSALPKVEETGSTYLENAELKARAYCRWSGLPALGDDSGLEVVALNNKPGLMSARYAGVGASDQVRMAKVLAELEALQRASQTSIDRTAFFKCALLLVLPDGQSFSAEYAMKGQVLDKPQGNKGFGYDPIILIESLGKTLAELEFAETCKIGFRAQAARELFNTISRVIG